MGDLKMKSCCFDWRKLVLMLTGLFAFRPWSKPTWTWRPPMATFCVCSVLVSQRGATTRSGKHPTPSTSRSARSARRWWRSWPVKFRPMTWRKLSTSCKFYFSVLQLLESSLIECLLMQLVAGIWKCSIVTMSKTDLFALEKILRLAVMLTFWRMACKSRQCRLWYTRFWTLHSALLQRWNDFCCFSQLIYVNIALV